MKKVYDFAVELADAMEGVRANTHYCAIQVRLERAFPTATHWRIDIHSIRWSFEEDGVRKRVVWPTSREAARYILDFDLGRPFKPFNVHLENPQIAEMPKREPNLAKHVSLKPSTPPKTHLLSRRVFGLSAMSTKGAA